MIRSHILLKPIQERLPKNLDTVIDVGAGVRPCLVSCKKRIIVEPHQEYVEVLRESGYRVIQGTALEVLPKLPRRATVLFLDVIEHHTRLEGEAALKIVEEFERAVLYTPDGFMPQHQEDGEKDPWGYNGWEWQTHRSGWTAKDFPNWTVTRWGKGLLCFR